MKILPFLNYLFPVVVITIIMVLIYATIQQTYRTGANDPQIQIAEDISLKIRQGKSIENIFQTDTIDIAKSLSPFVALYDASGKAIESTGFINNKMAELPSGVFKVAKINAEHRITWQPQHDVRMAMVLVYTNSLSIPFVAVGRSLREVEEREYILRKMVFMAWIICLTALLLSAVIRGYKNKLQSKNY